VISSIALSATGNVILDCQSQTMLRHDSGPRQPLLCRRLDAHIQNFVTFPSGAWQFTDTNRLCQQRYYRLSTP